MQYRDAVVANVLEVVSGGARKPAAMRKQVADGELACRIRISQPEGRIEIGDLRIPGHDPVANQRRHDGGGNRFGKGGDLEHRVGVDGLWLAGLAMPKTLEEDHLVIAHDADGETGYSTVRYGGFGKRFELRQGSSDALRREGIGRRRARPKRHCGDEDPNPPLTEIPIQPHAQASSQAFTRP